MTQTALWELQKAVYKRLSSDSQLMQLSTGVYDAVEEDLTFPYVTMGAPSTLNISTRTTFVEEVSVTLSTWSVANGKKESYALLNLIHQAIGKGLSIEGPFRLLAVSRPDLQVIDDADPRIKHGLARFTFTIKNN
ncbi:DUF3168 domain-containing protein [Planococcus versutus]|uniref:DUF3168 domain-containing protein n=1 Tax=Planococcus versutus TaxID=1302659 RepID=A0A1B1S5I4_9BACL|nr:DUF3168 domain-containing protein [Planococcus versutus]ANU28456.1 hypothetical protein I858_015815 [Planococcus versutus]